MTGTAGNKALTGANSVQLLSLGNTPQSSPGGVHTPRGTSVSTRMITGPPLLPKLTWYTTAFSPCPSYLSISSSNSGSHIKEHEVTLKFQSSDRTTHVLSQSLFAPLLDYK